MRLQTKLLLSSLGIFLITLGIVEYRHYHDINTEGLKSIQREARNVRNILMATRRVYHHQFLESGIPLTDKTIGFLPAHALSRISEDFTNWTASGLYFNNVSDRPRNPKNTADSLEKEAIDYYRENPLEKERFVSFKSEDDQLYYHYSAPIWVEEYCLKCHGKQEDAHITISANYDTSFNYTVGELRGIMSIKLPAARLQSLAWNTFKKGLWIELSVSVVILFLIFGLLKYNIINPLARITSGLKSVSKGRLDEPIEALSGEMAVIGETFNKMMEDLRNTTVSKDYMDNIIKSMADSLIVVNKDATIKRVNQATITLLGYKEDELIGNPISMVFEEEEKLLFEKSGISDLVKADYVTNVEKTYLSKDGGKIPVLFSGSVMRGEEGKIQGIVCVATDITERKKAEIELKVRDKFAVIGRISGSIAHDIRHPLATIKNSSYFLNITLKDLDEKAKKHLRLIDSEVTQANEIVTALMRLSESKVPEKGRLNINEYIKDFLTEFSLPERINFAVELDNECPEIMVDRLQLKQVFNNIVTNAVHAIPEEGTLTVKTRSVQSEEFSVRSSEKEGDFVGISFEDTGGGMKKEIMGNIFEPFFTTKGKGVGLGLSIVKDIITSNDGNISVVSEEGKGTTFRVKFPAMRG